MKRFLSSKNLQIAIAQLLAAASVSGFAQSFDESVLSARQFDAQYTAQQAAVQGSRILARQSGAAYYPFSSVTAGYSGSGSNKRSISLTQPLFSYDRYLSLKSADPLTALSEAEERQANTEMMLRVFTSMAEIIRQRESIRAFDVQISGLQEQLKRSMRMRQLGQGTITEVSDFEVRLAVAQANRVSLQNALQAAKRNFTLQTGLQAKVDTLSLQPLKPWRDGRSLEQLTEYVRNNSPTTVTAQRKLELAEIAAKRVNAQFIPEVVAQVSRSYTSGADATSSSNIALSLTAPLGVSQYFEVQKASIDVTRAQETQRYAKDAAAIETTRLFEAMQSFKQEVQIRERALVAAQQAVEGNEKSYQGGVKTNIDVLTSYQNLADAEVALVNSRLSGGDAELRLQLLLDIAPWTR
jgi:protease secretion system outer membrane protein